MVNDGDSKVPVFGSQNCMPKYINKKGKLVDYRVVCLDKENMYLIESSFCVRIFEEALKRCNMAKNIAGEKVNCVS